MFVEELSHCFFRSRANIAGISVSDNNGTGFDCFDLCRTPVQTCSCQT